MYAYQGESDTFEDDRRPRRDTTWTAIVTEDGNPGYRIERNGMVRHVLLNLSSNEPTVWVYFGSSLIPGEGDSLPLHFYDLQEDFE